MTKIKKGNELCKCLNKQLFDLVLDGLNLGLEIRSFVGSDGNSNNRARNTTGTTQSSLGRKENIRNVLIFTKQRQVEQDLERLGISYWIKVLVRYIVFCQNIPNHMIMKESRIE